MSDDAELISVYLACARHLLPNFLLTHIERILCQTVHPSGGLSPLQMRLLYVRGTETGH